MQDVRFLVNTTPDFPVPLFFYLGTVEEGRTFLSKAWPEARAVSDPDKKFYRAFQLKQGNLGQGFGPGALACALRATAKGHRGGIPVGDPWQMPGMFLVQGEAVLWQHDFAHIGDHPDLTALPALAAQRARS